MKPKHFQTTLLIAGSLMILGQPAAADLVQYWTMNDGGSSATAANLAVGGNVGQLSAGGVPDSWVTAGLHGPLTSRGTDPSTAALQLQSTFSDLMDGGDLGLNSTPAGGQATISMWLRPVTLASEFDPAPDGDRLFSQMGDTPCCDSGVGGSAHLGVQQSGADGLMVWSNNAALGWQELAAGDAPENTIVKDVWQHVAFVWNWGTVKAYVNGVETGQGISNFSFDSAGSGMDQDFGLGARFHLGDNFFGRGYDGLIDDLAIWDVALRADPVTMLAAGTAPREIDDSNPELPPDPTIFSWSANASGDWANANNWAAILQIPPNSAEDKAIFGDVIQSPQTVFTNADVTVNSIQFDNTNTYVIAGAGSVNLASNGEGDTPRVEVMQGLHQFQASVNLQNDTEANIVPSDATLELVNRLNLGGNTLTKTGEGTLLINNSFNTGEGTIIGAGGTIGGGGSIGGNLDNTGGTVAPGNSPGVLSVTGNYTQDVAGTLLIEISGLETGEEHDVLAVGGTVTLAGNLEIALLGFTPESGDTFDVVTAESIVDSGLTLTGASGFSYDIVGGALEADFDIDGNVDGDDFLRWQGGFGTPSGADKMDGDFDNDGDVDGDDFLGWQQEFGMTGGGDGAILRLTANGQAAVVGVPEPASFVLLGLALLGMWLLRR